MISDHDLDTDPAPVDVLAPVGVPTLRQAGRVLLFTAVYTAVFVGLVVVTVRATSASPSPFALFMVVAAGAGTAWAVAVYVHLLRRDGLGLAALGFARPTWGLAHLLWQVPLIMAAGAVTAAVVAGGLLQQGPPPDDRLDVVAASAAWPTVIGVLLAAAVVAPLLEEVLFRGLLFRSIARTLPTTAAAIISSAVFAAAHIVPAVMPYLFVVGLGCCWLYARHRTLWAPIVLHAVNNTLVTIAAVSSSSGQGVG